MASHRTNHSGDGQKHTLRPYTLVARFYDQLHGDSWRMTQRTRERVLGKILHLARSVCDLGCGTGTTALQLARHGLRVYAVDLSPAMWRNARRKARAAGLPVRVICADMRVFRLPEQVDLVTCEFNPLNHLPRRSDLTRVARSVARALRLGGRFYFDINTRRTLEELYPSPHWFEKRGFCVVLHGGYDRSRQKGWLDFEWFLPAGKSWRRYREHIEDVWWSDQQIRRALHRGGSSSLRYWEGASVRPASPHRRPGYDTYYLAQKGRR